MFSNIRQRCHVMKSHSKVTEMHFWMIQRANKEVFGHFRDFGLLHRLDIAYCDGTKCFSGFGNLTRSWRIIQKSLKYIFEWSKAPKRRLLATFWDSGLCYGFLPSTWDVNLICCRIWKCQKVQQVQRDHWDSRFNRLTLQIQQVEQV